MDCVFIISVINFIDKKTSYSDSRSVFTPKDRLDQTKNTIFSIKRKMPNAKVLFFELGLADVSQDIEEMVDKYYFLGNKRAVRFSVDSKFKGLGEAVGILYASKEFTNEFDRFFKVSGRYFLDDGFNISNWSNDKVNFLERGRCVSTRLYSFPMKLKSKFITALKLSLPFLLVNISIERLLYMFIAKKHINFMDNIGISGLVAVDSDFIKE